MNITSLGVANIHVELDSRLPLDGPAIITIVDRAVSAHLPSATRSMVDADISLFNEELVMLRNFVRDIERALSFEGQRPVYDIVAQWLTIHVSQWDDVEGEWFALTPGDVGYCASAFTLDQFLDHVHSFSCDSLDHIAPDDAVLSQLPLIVDGRTLLLVHPVGTWRISSGRLNSVEPTAHGHG